MPCVVRLRTARHRSVRTRTNSEDIGLATFRASIGRATRSSFGSPGSDRIQTKTAVPSRFILRAGPPFSSRFPPYFRASVSIHEIVPIEGSGGRLSSISTRPHKVN